MPPTTRLAPRVFPYALLCATMWACATQVPTTTIAAGPPPDWITARSNILAASSRATPYQAVLFESHDAPRQFRVRQDALTFLDRGVIAAKYSTTGRAEPFEERRTIPLTYVAGEMQRSGKIVISAGFHGDRYVQLWMTPFSKLKYAFAVGNVVTDEVAFASQADAEAFVRALYDVVRAAPTYAANEATFEQQAATWRAANPKPALSESGNRQRVLAEAAARDKRFDEAIEHFESALATDPTWSSGNYNLALLYGETEDYAEAIRYMKRFLLLEPNSREAAAARDKIIVWEDRLAHPAR